MTNSVMPVTEDELHAFVDEALPADRRQEVEAWLAAHADDAARVAAWQAQRDAIRARFDAIIDEPVPARLRLQQLAPLRRRWVSLAAAAALLAFVAGGAAGWFGRAAFEGGPATRQIVTEAMDAHRLYIAEVRHPIEVPADASHLMPWLSRRVGHQLRAPDLTSFGLKLIGGRLLPGPRSPAALFMYEGPSGERFTLYCASASGADSALHYRASGPFAAFYWVEAEVSYVVSGPADRTRLQQVAEAAYDQIDQRQQPRQRPPERKSTLLLPR